jgi:quercetin dioxygenase-like cupin family protein
MQFKIVRRDQSAPPTPSELQTQLLAEGLFPYEWSNPPGDTYAPHIHDYDKVIVVVRGSITWALGMPAANQAIETRAGDRVELPRGTWHAAEVGSEGVVCLEGHIV